MVAREPDASTARLTLYFEMLPPENAAFRDGGPRRGEYVTVPRNSTAFFAYEIPPRNASRWDFNAYARLTFGELAVESNRIPVTVGTDDVE